MEDFLVCEDGQLSYNTETLHFTSLTGALHESVYEEERLYKIISGPNRHKRNMLSLGIILCVLFYMSHNYVLIVVWTVNTHQFL